MTLTKKVTIAVARKVHGKNLIQGELPIDKDRNNETLL